MTAELAPLATAAAESNFPLWLRASHLLNFFLIGLLIRSGWEIISSHPRFYWKNQCTPGTEWIKFTKKQIPPGEGNYMARDDELSLSPLISLPGKKNIGLGRQWHAVVTMLWVANGLFYVGMLFATGLWKRIVPTSWDVFPEAWNSLLVYLSFKVPSIEHFQPYDALQQLMYFTVVFIAAPLMIVTGPLMSPAVVGRFPWYARMFGNRQIGRSLHFLGMAFLTMFICIHVPLVFIVHPDHNLPNMVFGQPDTAKFAQAFTTMVIVAFAVIGAWIALSYWSLSDKRRTQRFLLPIGEFFRKITVDKMVSRQREKKVWSEKDISPYHWSNGHHPVGDESPEWNALAENDFKDYKLTVSMGEFGDEKVELSIDDMKEMVRVQEQITLHTCMQGFTGIAKWTGPRLEEVMKLLGPRPEGAKYVMVTSYGLAQKMHDGRPLEPYYSCIPWGWVEEDETILAYEMNGKPLPYTFGAPLRLRVESIHGYKMVKYIKSVEYIADYAKYGDGMGGTREDSGYQVINARI